MSLRYFLERLALILMVESEELKIGVAKNRQLYLMRKTKLFSFCRAEAKAVMVRANYSMLYT